MIAWGLIGQVGRSFVRHRTGTRGSSFLVAGLLAGRVVMAQITASFLSSCLAVPRKAEAHPMAHLMAHSGAGQATRMALIVMSKC